MWEILRDSESFFVIVEFDFIKKPVLFFVEVVDDIDIRWAENSFDFVHLIDFVFSGKQREQGANLEQDTPDAPHVHFLCVVAFGHDALGRAVPARADVLGEGLLRVDAFAGAEVGNHQVRPFDEDVFRLDVAVEYSRIVHIFYPFQQLKRPDANFGLF